jgi:protoporphyrinogen oxidase
MIKKIKLLIVLPFILAALALNSVSAKTYDVIIVGGGLSGLSAAYHLNKYDTLLLESNRSLGGILTSPTKNTNIPNHFIQFNYPYKNIFPFNYENAKISNMDSPIGIYFDNQLYYGDYPMDCIEQLTLKYPELEDVKYFNKKLIRLNKLSEKSYIVLNSFFQAKHPFFNIRKSMFESLHSDSFARPTIRLLENGSYGIINNYLNNIKTKVQLNSRVVSVKEKNNKVEVIYIKNGKKKTSYSKTVILASPYLITKKIVPSILPPMKTLFENISLKKLVTVSFSLKNTSLDNFSCISTPALEMSHIYKFNLSDKTTLIMFLFYKEKANYIWKLSDNDLIDNLIEDMADINLLAIKQKNIIYTHVNRYELPVYDTYKDVKASQLTISDKIYIAGGYVPAKARWHDLAILSGKRTASIISKIITKTKTKTKTKIKTRI